MEKIDLDYFYDLGKIIIFVSQLRYWFCFLENIKGEEFVY